MPNPSLLEREAQLDRDDALTLLAEATPRPWRAEQGVTHLEIRGPHQKNRAIARVYCDIDAALICSLVNQIESIIQKAEARGVERMREAAAQVAQDRQRHHDDYCRRECRCADGNHIAAAIRSLEV